MSVKSRASRDNNLERMTDEERKCLEKHFRETIPDDMYLLSTEFSGIIRRILAEELFEKMRLREFHHFLNADKTRTYVKQNKFSRVCYLIKQLSLKIPFEDEDIKTYWIAELLESCVALRQDGEPMNSYEKRRHFCHHNTDADKQCGDNITKFKEDVETAIKGALYSEKTIG